MNAAVTMGRQNTAMVTTTITTTIGMTTMATGTADISIETDVLEADRVIKHPIGRYGERLL